MGIVREYAGKRPALGSRVYLAETAAVIGDVVLGDDVSVWYNSVVRGDCNWIRIGDRSNVQDNCAIHVTVKTHPTTLEEEVTLGHGAIVHGATVRRGALIGIRATDRLVKKARRLNGVKVLHVNSTRQGGGVAEILSSLTPLMNDLGIETRWHVIDGNSETNCDH